MKQFEFLGHIPERAEAAGIGHNQVVQRRVDRISPVVVAHHRVVQIGHLVGQHGLMKHEIHPPSGEQQRIDRRTVQRDPIPRMAEGRIGFLAPKPHLAARPDTLQMILLHRADLGKRRRIGHFEIDRPDPTVHIGQPSDSLGERMSVRDAVERPVERIAVAGDIRLAGLP